MFYNVNTCILYVYMYTYKNINMLNKISYQIIVQRSASCLPRRQRPSALPMPKVLEASERVEKEDFSQTAALGRTDLAVTSSILPGLDSRGESWRSWRSQNLSTSKIKSTVSQRQKAASLYPQSLLGKELLIREPMAENWTESSAIGKHRDDT